ncbi:MFS transporter [Sulfitobacter aestuariivivens]|uniref:MFS transporter n=1 Tax=Sulfitobacter aestuariivivens TaxID=2766981 RepID=UPI0036229D36
MAAGVLFDRRYRARVMAVVSAFWGMSAFLGPLLGGLFVEFATWRIGFWFFTVQAGLLALWILSCPEAVAPQNAETPNRFPLARLLVLCLAVVLISAGGARVELARTTVLILAGLACLIWFVWRDGRAGPTRMLPAAPWNLTTPTGGTLSMLFFISMATIALLAYGPLLMTVVHDMSALTAGYIVAASSVGWTVAAVAISGRPEREDRYWIIAGMSLTTLSIAGFTYAVPAGPVGLIAVASFVEGAGFGMAWTFILRRVTALVPAHEVQRVSGAMPTVQRIGYALGAAFVGIIANATGFLEMDTAQDAARVAQLLFLSCLPLALLALGAMVGLVRKHPYDATL